MAEKNASEYQGLARVVGERLRYPTMNQTSKENLQILLDVMIMGDKEDYVKRELKMSIAEFGEYPELGQTYLIALKGDRVMIID